MRWILGLSLLAFLALGAAMARRNAPGIAIRNQSDLAIRSVEISVGDEKAQMRAAAVDEAGRNFLPLRAPARREGPLTITLHLHGGGERRIAAGWISPSMVGNVVLTVVSADSVRFETRSSAP